MAQCHVTSFCLTCHGHKYPWPSLEICWPFLPPPLDGGHL
jgi:hypothetical protein